MAGEQAIDKADVVCDEESEGQADDAGASDQPAIQPTKPSTRVGKGQGHRRGDQHHPSDGAHTKNQQVQNAPERIVNGG